ncbi:Xaa-Pro dipeptidase PepQ [Thermococcus thioreducens]|uniref:Xaa-Pro dipeptidase n=1 Tax=Thermococcus thioreducens TaxID=277988 RepID=A0A0Q2MTT5_9EURY|nr:Xaa-Pro dipeptidase PepQ [Thermococcus thioreducens]ASJ12446.1 peptidase M24 [Thermococcus thioreducens]KQH83175.1 peptidase M24 [Thermococcus thioreducens]SEV90668.1 Xaa-Pro dipeptidase [Thermococcus thioreducens]
MRIKRLQEFIEEKELDAALITAKENLFYFTGSSPVLGGYLVVAPDDVLFIVPELEYEEARETSKVPVDKFKTGKELYEKLKGFKLTKLGIEGKTSFSTVQSLKEKAGVEDFVVVDDVIKELRIIKTPEEIEVIKAACEIADMAMMAALEEISEGKREREIAAKMEYVMKMNGAEKTAFDTIIASGWRSALPHGVASDKRIEKGDLVVIDEGALYRHYHSDTTRTIVVGSPNEKQKDIYYAVLEAQRKGVEAARPGITAKELDTIVRDVIKEYGYGDYFIHSTGHGVGLQIHEWPRVSQQDETVLKPGMVITIEPGIYLPKFGGVRIEDTVVITENGARRLTKTERELI